MPPIQRANKPTILERNIVANKVKIHIKSVFSGQTSLDEALKKIAARKLAARK